MELISRNIYICLVCSGASQRCQCSANCAFFPNHIFNKIVLFFLRRRTLNTYKIVLQDSVYYFILFSQDHSVMSLFPQMAASSAAEVEGSRDGQCVSSCLTAAVQRY